MPIVGMIYCDGNVNQEKRSAYQDLKEIERLRSINSEILEKSYKKARPVIKTVRRIENDIKSEIEICEAAENCENSQELVQLLKEYATALSTAESLLEETEYSLRTKEIKEVFKKYAQ